MVSHWYVSAFVYINMLQLVSSDAIYMDRSGHELV